MRKNYGAKAMLYPMPVLIIGSYDENGTPDAMNAAWGGISEETQISICVSEDHKTTKNILARGAFTVSVADAAVIVVSGKSGVEAGTEKAWEICEKYNLPRMIYVTGMDADNASFKNVVEKLTEMYGKKIAPFHFPIRENEKFVGYVNVVSETANRWKDKEVVARRIL